MRHIPAASTIALMLLCQAAAWASDVYMTPAGAGKADGSSWENALSYAAGEDSLQKAWDGLPGGGVLNLGIGEYPVRGLDLHAQGAEEAARRTLRGQIADGKRAVFVGTWDKNNPAAGVAAITLPVGATWWAIENIGVRACLGAVWTQSPGRLAHGRISNVQVEGTRDAFIFFGGATARQPEIGTHDILIQDCTVQNYTKRAFRLRDGCYDIRLERCVADAGGKEWATEAFQMSYAISGGTAGVYDHDITFTDCIARNNYWDAGESRYWQGDGFCAEGNTYNLTFIGCEAYDNADGGWDVKTRNPLLIGCVGMRNKKNFRFWSDDPGVVMVNCLSFNAFKRGGNSASTGLWVGGKARLIRCTFVETANPIDVHDVKWEGEKKARMSLDLEGCIIVCDDKKQAELEAFPGAETDCVFWRPAAQPEEALGFRGNDEAKALTTAGANFDSKSLGAAKGYHSGWRTQDVLAKARAKQPLLPTEGKALPAKPVVCYNGSRPDNWYVGGWKGAMLGETKAAGREGRTALSFTASAAGGGKYTTKNIGSAINLADREDAAWELCFGIKGNPGGLEIRLLCLDEPAQECKEIPLRSKQGDDGWQEARIPLSEFAKDPTNAPKQFAGFTLRANGAVPAPVLLDAVRLEPITVAR